MLPADRSKGTTDGNEALTRDLDRAGIVMTEVRDGLEAGYQLSGQPHQLDVAARRALKPPA